MRNWNPYCCNHAIVRHCWICSFNFFHCIIVSLANIILTKFKFREVNLSDTGSCIRSTIFRTFYFNAIFLKNKCKFVSFKLTTIKFLSEIQLKWNWNAVYTFFSWFFWFLNCVCSWVVVVNNLTSCIFDIFSCWGIRFHGCHNIKFIVTTKCKLSCINDLSVVGIAKWFREASFKGRCNHATSVCDIKLRSNVWTCHTIVNLDWVHIQLGFIIVICDADCLNIFSVGCAKLFCIQPYLVNQFRAWFHCLRIQVFWFIVGCTIRIWISVCITILVCQFRIIVKQLVACDIEFFCRNNVFFWIELRFFRWFHLIVKLFIWCVYNILHDCFRCTIMRDWNPYSRNHCIVCHRCVWTCNFVYSVVVSLT